MSRTLLLCVIGASLWSAVAAGGQATPSGALSAALRTRVQDAPFGIITSIRGLPLGVRERLQTMFGGTLDIAEPRAEFQATDVVTKPGLPRRRMIAAACSNDFYCLLYYERGGIAHTWHVVLFHWSPDETRFEWGGTAPGGLTTLDEVRKAILSGAVKAQAGSW